MLDIKQIRNFCIIAHIDHGKSTLSDRFLEITGQRSLKKGQSRVMDTLEIEQERGITVKMQSARMEWNNYILNLIDTPGHVDFSFEVSRSVVASEGALLLVDAKQGIQSQTISNAKMAREHGLFIIPVLSKIDLPDIDIPKRKFELSTALGFKETDIFCASGKTGTGVTDLLDAITIFVPSPESRVTSQLQVLVYDSLYDEHKGVILLVRIFGGSIMQGKKLFVKSSINEVSKIKSFIVQKVGWVRPEFEERDILNSGEVGFIETGVKDYAFINVGETLVDNVNTVPLYKYQKPTPRIFASIFPIETSEYTQLKNSVNKLSLNDPSVTVSSQKSEMLGTGFRIGFLGVLHMEVFQERLEREFNSSLIVTSPTVMYKARKHDGGIINIETPSDFVDPVLVDYYEEPFVHVEILTPVNYMSSIIDLCVQRRGSNPIVETSDNLYAINFLKIVCDMPLSEVISGFFDKLKSLSRGFASMDYSEVGYRKIDLVKVVVLVNKKEIPALSFLDVRSNARNKAIALLNMLKETIPRHQFEIPLQASLGSQIIARENIKAFRKDVLHKLHASDPSRRAKLLEKQRKGKLRMKEIGNVNIPQEAFLSVLKI